LVKNKNESHACWLVEKGPSSKQPDYYSSGLKRLASELEELLEGSLDDIALGLALDDLQLIELQVNGRRNVDLESGEVRVLLGSLPAITQNLQAS